MSAAGPVVQLELRDRADLHQLGDRRHRGGGAAPERRHRHRLHLRHHPHHTR